MAAVSLRGVSKRFALHDTRGRADTLKRWLTDLVRGRREPAPTHRVLEGIDLEIERGEVFGIIGRNGAGKSTLLRLVNGIYKPDAGTIRTEGRVAAIYALGGGFHHDFTGRDNVLIEGMMLGLSRREVERRMDEILRFADLGEYVDQPLRTYSSGMYMRLAFAVALQADPEILILDEVLAVGDQAFMAKCFQRLEDLKRRRVTILLVTHDLAAVRRWCTRALWLDGGRIRLLGEPETVIGAYRDHVRSLQGVPAAAGAPGLQAAPAVAQPRPG